MAPPPGYTIDDAVITGFDLYSSVRGADIRFTFKELDIFDSASAKWTRGPDLPTSRHGLGVVAVGSTLYVMSGGPTPGVSQTAVCEALDVR